MADLEFDPQAHSYTLDGRVLPSVTQILGPYEDWGAVPADVMAAAMDRGTRVHAACALIADGLIGSEDCDEDIQPYLQQFERFLAESGFTLHLSEERVHSSLGYAGTLDLYGDLPKRKKSLIDIKSGSVPRSAGPQTAAYARALRETLGHEARYRYALLLTTERYKLVQMDDPQDDQIFLAALTMHNWSNRK